MDNGITEATIKPARKFPKKRTKMNITINAPSIKFLLTVWIALSTIFVRSKNASMTTPLGSVFWISAILAFFMIYDAKVIRGAAGKQAQSLNRLIEMFNEEEDQDMDKLREVLGHSILEIIGGILIGILVAIWIV